MVALFICLFSCRNVADEEIAESKFLDLDNSETKELTSSFTNLELIPLETSEEAVIGMPVKVLYHNEKYYVLDRRAFSVLVFDSEGKYLKKLGALGRGPGEYLNLYDIGFNPYTEDLELMSPRGVLISYNETSDTYITNLQLPRDIESVHHFINLNEDVILFYSAYEKEQLLFYSRSADQVIEKALRNTDPENKIRAKSFFSPFALYNNSVYFLDSNTQSVYEVSDLGLQLRYELNFGRHQFNIDQIDPGLDPSAFRAVINEKSFAFPILNYYMNDKILGLSFYFDQENRMIVYDKKTAITHYVNMTQSDHFIPFFGTTADGELIGCILNPSHVGEMFPPSILDKSEQKKLSDIRVEGNPVLVKYTLN